MLKALGSPSSTAKTNREIDTLAPNPQQALLLYSHFTVKQLWASYSRESLLRIWVGWWVMSFYPQAPVDSAWTERNDCQAGCSGLGDDLQGNVFKSKLLVSLKLQVTLILPPNIEGRDCRLRRRVPAPDESCVIVCWLVLFIKLYAHSWPGSNSSQDQDDFVCMRMGRETRKVTLRGEHDSSRGAKK